MPPIHVALVTVNKRKEIKVSCTIQDLPPVDLSKKFQPWMDGFGELLLFTVQGDLISCVCLEKEDINKGNNRTTTSKEEPKSG